MANIEGYLIVQKRKARYAPSYSTRWGAKKPSLKSDEVAIKINLNIPDEVFVKPQLQATITVPTSAVSKLVIDADIQDNIRDAVMRSAGVDLTITVVDPQKE